MGTTSTPLTPTSPVRRVLRWAAERQAAAYRRAELESALAGDHGPGVRADVLAAQERAAA